MFDSVIVGAGAAGLMTAIASVRAGSRVLLLDGREKVGAKILMSGGTRCNVTNEAIEESDYESESIKLARNILRGFTSYEAIEFFEGLGVTFVLEEGGKYFPSTHSGKTILEALLKAIETENVLLKTGCKVSKVSFADKVFFVEGDGFSFKGKTVVLTTGGLSFPQTGSDGTGYSIAGAFGHTLIPTTASLTPLTTDNVLLKSLTGIAVQSKLTLLSDDKPFRVYEGPLLFTHFGFSGPAVLNISRHWLRLKDAHQVKITVDFLPRLKTDQLDALLRIPKGQVKKSIKNYLAEMLPEGFVSVILECAGVEDKKTLSVLTKEDRKIIVQHFKSFDLPVSGAVGYSKAEVTAGGIDLKELDAKTLQSKLQEGLFFAGEIVDVDGRIGGFNFQWAWSSAVAASRGVTKYLTEFKQR